VHCVNAYAGRSPPPTVRGAPQCLTAEIEQHQADALVPQRLAVAAAFAEAERDRARLLGRLVRHVRVAIGADATAQQSDAGSPGQSRPGRDVQPERYHKPRRM
jgi:hypothetical protein